MISSALAAILSRGIPAQVATRVPLSAKRPNTGCVSISEYQSFNLLSFPFPFPTVNCVLRPSPLSSVLLFHGNASGRRMPPQYMLPLYVLFPVVTRLLFLYSSLAKHNGIIDLIHIHRFILTTSCTSSLLSFDIFLSLVGKLINSASEQSRS